jgi:TolA-binding protein
MKRFLFTAALVCSLGLGWMGSAYCQDAVYLKGAKKPVSGLVVAESPKEIKLRGRAEPIPAEDIRDIEYNIKDPDVRIKAYRPAANAEAELQKAADDAGRLKKLDVVLGKYQALLPKVDPKQPFVRRHIVYKIALYTALKADLEGTETARILAIEKLKAFTTKYPTAWQLVRALTTLARMQVEQKDYASAEETFKAMAEAPVSEAARQDAELAAAQLSMKSGKYDEARRKLEAVAAKLPADSPAAQKARLAEAECLAATKNLPAAQDLLKKLLAQAKDPGVKAVAYNTLGYCYFLADQMKDACWAFLWVDVVFNQDKAEHAKALYYLNQVFARLNQPERARECLQALLNDRQLAGQEYQRKAQEERKK